MTRPAVVLLLCIAAAPASAAKLTSVTVLDRDYLVVQISDGDVMHNENPGSETVSRYTPALNTSAAVSTASWTITSPQDGNYGGAGRQPTSVLPQDEAERPRPDGVDRQRLPLRVHLPALDLPQAAEPHAAGDDLHGDGRRGDERDAHRPAPSPSTSTTAARRRCTSTSPATSRRPTTRPPTSTRGSATAARATTPRSRGTRSTSTTWARARRRRSAP